MTHDSKKTRVLCVQSLIAEEGSESIKLETQLVITENGCQRLDSFPYEDI
jgi:Xaa-Pro dipeptidase